MVPVEVGGASHGMANFPKRAPPHPVCGGSVGAAVGRAVSRVPL